MGRILAVRVDKIGDLLLTAPVQPALAEQNEVSWLLGAQAEGIASIIAPQLKFQITPSIFTLGNFFSLLRWAWHQPRWDKAIVFYAPFWVVFALWLSWRGPLCGRYSQWWSFLFYSKGLRQRRSLSEKHELDYNFELAEFFLETKNTPRLPLRLSAQMSFADRFGGWLLAPYRFVVVHPGMAGSAVNWSLKNYQDLIAIVSGRFRVVVTGTATDREMIEPLKKVFQDNPQILFLDGQLNLNELTCLLQNAKSVIVPSTGVAHIAATSGAHVVALYPNNQQQSPARWAPIGPRVEVLAPIEQVTVEAVWSKVNV